MVTFEGSSGVCPGEFSQDCELHPEVAQLLHHEDEDTVSVMASEDVEELLPLEHCFQRKLPPVNARSMEKDNRGLFGPGHNAAERNCH